MAVEVFKSNSELTDEMQVTCNAMTHSFILDEPTDLGGTDTGMNPVEALLSALGACKCIVASCFAKSHNVNLKDIKIEMEGDLDTDGFLGKNPDAKIGFSAIRTKMYIKSDSKKEDIQKFTKFIDENCPVMDTLVNTPEMKTIVTIEE